MNTPDLTFEMKFACAKVELNNLNIVVGDRPGRPGDRYIPFESRGEPSENEAGGVRRSL